MVRLSVIMLPLTQLTIGGDRGLYRALAHPIASVLYLETGEILIERITQRQTCVEPCDQYLNLLVLWYTLTAPLVQSLL